MVGERGHVLSVIKAITKYNSICILHLEQIAKCLYVRI